MIKLAAKKVFWRTENSFYLDLKAIRDIMER